MADFPLGGSKMALRLPNPSTPDCLSDPLCAILGARLVLTGAMTATSPSNTLVREPDTVLVERCLQGDEEAWTSLVERYQRLIFSVPLKCGLSRDDAGDVFQMVCVELIRSLPQLREPKALPRWLAQVAYRHSLRISQRQGRTEPLDDADAPSADTPAEALLDEAEREHMVRQAMEQLPERCRELVRMLFFETPARPYHEIAEQLSLATGSVGFIRGRCLERLRRLLQKAGFS
jgi:RNA polymerase sigma factor (sigma-70 family)